MLQDVIGAFVSLRDQRRSLEESVKELKEKEHETEQILWDMIDGMGLKSIKSTEYGTVTCVIRITPYIANSQSFVTWIKATGNYQLLRDEVRLRELREYIQEREKALDPEACPPGVEVKNEKVISIRGGTYSE